MSRYSLHPEKFEVTVVIDGEGVVRVVQCTHDQVTVTPHELGQLLTALVKAFVSTDDDEETFDVRLN